jgi:hypothetical protein
MTATARMKIDIQRHDRRHVQTGAGVRAGLPPLRK